MHLERTLIDHNGEEVAKQPRQEVDDQCKNEDPKTQNKSLGHFELLHHYSRNRPYFPFLYLLSVKTQWDLALMVGCNTKQNQTFRIRGK